MAKNQPYVKPVTAGEETVTEQVTASTAPTDDQPAGTIAPSATAEVGTTVNEAIVEEIKVVKQEVKTEVTITKESASLLDRLAATKNQVVINAVDSIRQYMVNMNPTRTMTVDEGARHQVSLFRAIRTIIDFSKNDFQLAFATVLRLFDENKDGVFHERYVFRFMESVTLNQEERRAFERILNLIKMAAPVIGRKDAMNQINFQKTLQYVFTEDGRRRVLAFFNK